MAVSSPARICPPNHTMYPVSDPDIYYFELYYDTLTDAGRAHVRESLEYLAARAAIGQGSECAVGMRGRSHVPLEASQLWPAQAGLAVRVELRVVPRAAS